MAQESGSGIPELSLGTGQLPMMQKFRIYVTDLWRRALRRRSQKDDTTWTKANRLAAAWLPRFGFFIHGLWSGSPPDTQGRSPVRKSRTPGSVRGYPVTGIPTATLFCGGRFFQVILLPLSVTICCSCKNREISEGSLPVRRIVI
jgi:hypothetical protein